MVIPVLLCCRLLIARNCLWSNLDGVCLFLLPSQGIQRKDASCILSQLPHVEGRVLCLLFHAAISLSLTPETFSHLRHISHSLSISNFLKVCCLLLLLTLFSGSKRNSNLMQSKSYLIYACINSVYLFTYR